MGMTTPDWFLELLERVGNHDDDAVAEFVSRYQPEIRTLVRAWLRPWESRLRKMFDSEDICQSILAWFFLKDATSRYDLQSPEQLRKLFSTMVRNRVYYHIRRVKSEKSVLELPADVPVIESLPADAVADRELRELIARKLSTEEQAIADFRLQGATWDAIANSLGGTADGRRMQFARLAQRMLADSQ